MSSSAAPAAADETAEDGATGEGEAAVYEPSTEAAHAEALGELEALAASTEGLCEVLDDGGGWTSSLQTRASWLLGLLVCQSFSSFILADNEQLLVAQAACIPCHHNQTSSTNLT